jgi:hypothetical protein
MPIGFYTKETFRPFYTTEEYKDTDRYKSEMDNLYMVDNKIKRWFGYPRVLWYKVLMILGILAKPEED